MTIAFLVAVLFGAQGPVTIRVYLGPPPNASGLVMALPKGFADSYVDLKKAHDKAKPSVFQLVEDPAQADVLLTITQRGDVATGTTVSTGVALGSGVAAGQTTPQTEPVLLAKLTVRATGDTVDLSGKGTGWNDRTKWSLQAERIYKQAAEWATTNP